jgi:site-specific DNA recombinase
MQLPQKYRKINGARMQSDFEVVPLAGIEPALLAESDFESDASTSSAIGARDKADGGDIERVPAQGQSA